MTLARKVERFARKHKKALWWSAGIGGGGILLLALWPKSASAQQFSIRVPRTLTGTTAPPQFLDQQLAALQVLLNAAQKAGNASYAASTQARITAVQAKIAYLNSPQGIADSLNALSWLLKTNYAAMTNGNVVILNADTFRKIYTHQGTKVIDLISSVFYPHGVCAQFGGPCNLFSTDELANHAHCQTFANQVVQLGQGWEAPFYTSVYRYPSQNPNYAGNAIDPHTDPGEWENQRQQAVEAAIKKASHDADFGDAMDNFNKVLGVTGAAPVGTLYTMVVSDVQRTRLSQLAIDMMTKNNVPVPGEDIPEPQRSMVLASVGAGIVAHLIDVLESPSADINPCVRKLDAGLVFQMFSATLGVVIGLAIGPALSGIGIAMQIASTIQKLAQLSK